MLKCSKNTSVVTYCPFLCSVFWPPLLISQLTHAWASIANNNRAAVLNQFLLVKQAARHKLCLDATCWCHRVTDLRAGLLMRRFRSSVFTGADFGPFETFGKHDMSPLKLLWWWLCTGRLTVEGIPQRTGWASAMWTGVTLPCLFCRLNTTPRRLDLGRQGDICLTVLRARLRGSQPELSGKLFCLFPTDVTEMECRRN